MQASIGFYATGLDLNPCISILLSILEHLPEKHAILIANRVITYVTREEEESYTVKHPISDL